MNTATKCLRCDAPADPPSDYCIACLLREVNQRKGTESINVTEYSQDCRVSMYFAGSDVPLTYRSTRAAARRLMHDVQRQGIAKIAIDDQLTPDLPRLPLEYLYSPA